VEIFVSRDGTVVSVGTLSDKKVEIKIKDKGCGIEDVEQCKLPLYTTDTSGERGGMGFAIMESFMDKLTVKSAVDKGTVVTLVKVIS
jgi:stage II sporulation protein AB (anti-sigma F factor)